MRPLYVMFAVSLVALGGFHLGLASAPSVPPHVEPEVPPQTVVDIDPASVYRSVPPRIPKLSPDAPCTPLHFGFDGNPHRFHTTILGRYTVPEGRAWRFTNVSLLAERHHGGPYAVAGEWTVQLGAHHDGVAVTVSESSLDNGSGLALQGQGPVDATFDQGDKIIFSTWLRPYTESAGGRVPTDPSHYYYTLGASGTDCPS